MERLWRRLSLRRTLRDGGPIYDEIAPGFPIPTDREELEAIEFEMTNRAKPGGIPIEFMEQFNAYNTEQAYSFAASALLSLAASRYDSEKLRLAANTSIRGLGFAAQGKEGVDYQKQAELWQLLARIHATVGRFDTSASLLALAIKAHKKSKGALGRKARKKSTLAFESPKTALEWLEWSSVTGLKEMWDDTVASLRVDIALRRCPKPSRSMFTPTAATGWLESPAEVG